jgi:signal transduction histidine kinase
MKLKLPKLSIFLKLVLTVLVFGLLLNICVIIVFRLTTDNKPRKFLRDFTHRMEKNLIYEIGVPPDTVKAKQICDDLDIDMRFESPGRIWTTSDEIPALDAILSDTDTKRRFDDDESIIANFKGKPYSVIRYPQGVFIIRPFSPDFLKTERSIILLIIFISGVILLLYFLLRKIFNPLKQLTTAVQQIGDGNYSVKLPVERSDELGELAESIKEMSNKINNSIKSKEQLLIDVSHELRSPLTRIKLGLEVDSSKEKIIEDVNEMERMVTSLLENYKAESVFSEVNPARTEIISLLEDTISEYDNYERLVLNKTKDEIFISGDFEKLQVVFRNLIDNALKYSAGKIEITADENKESVTIKFKDYGSGIAEEDLKYLFEPFYRADRSRSRRTGGFGLGLSICKKIIDAHKAEITINSKVNEGTEVTLKFKKEV